MATPTRQMSRPQVRPMQLFRQQQSQALRPAVQQPMQQAQTMQQPMQQQKIPMVQRPQAMQPTSTRVQQPMQRATGFRPDLAPTGYAPGAGPEMPTPPGGGGVMKMPETGGLEPAPGGNELSSTGQRGMPKYDPRGMDNTQPVQDPAYAAYAAEKQRQLDAGRAQREGALFNPPPPQKPVLQPGEVDMPIGHAGIGFGQDSALARDNPQFGMPAPGGSELSTTGQQGMPKYNPTGMGGGEMKMMRRGGKVTSVKKYAKGGAVKSTPVKASSRGDGIAQRGKTKGKIY